MAKGYRLQIGVVGSPSLEGGPYDRKSDRTLAIVTTATARENKGCQPYRHLPPLIPCDVFIKSNEQAKCPRQSNAAIFEALEAERTRAIF